MRILRRTDRMTLIRGEVESYPTADLAGFAGGALHLLRPSLAVSLDMSVAAGDRLFSDRKRPWITAVSPVSGRVTQLEPGPRRGLAALEITVEGNRVRTFDPPSDDREGLVSLLIASGLWIALRRRPFGKVPDPATRPEALFVTLTEGRPGAPDPATAMPPLTAWFEAGLRALLHLTDGRVHLCHPPDLTPPDVPGVTCHVFSAGLPSAHIHALHPVAYGGEVWQIHWQEVVALGHLLTTGTIWPRRIVALSGPAMARPGLVSAPIGARLHDLTEGRLASGSLRLMTGTMPSASAAFLPPGIYQVAAQPHDDTPRRAFRLWPGQGALIPNFWDEAVLPKGVLPVPLLRALASGDADAARSNGVLALVEEDLAPFDARFGSGYTRLLRQCLNNLEAAP